jgi:hypothetical protein
MLTYRVPPPPLLSAADSDYLQSYSAWRHWGCVTPKIVENIKKNFSEASELDGFEDLTETDKAKVVKAYEDGHIADEDVPDSARQPEGEEKPKKKASGKKAAKKDEDAEDGDTEEAEEKPKKKATKKAARKAEDAGEDGEEEVPEEKPKKAKTSKKACPISSRCSDKSQLTTLPSTEG